MVATVELLRDGVILVGGALVATLAARAVRAPAMIGYLLAGITLGPPGLGLVRGDEITALSDIALVLLLFTVGLELSPAPLLKMGRRLLAASLLQMGGTTILAALVLVAVADLGWFTAIILGVAISPASTAIVLKQLSDRGETDSAAGNVSTGILLIQDVLVVLALIALPILAGGDKPGTHHGPVGSLLAVLGFAAITLLARAAMPLVIRVVFRESSREVMTLFAVAMAVAGAWIASKLGWSPALGAAIAGLLLAAADVRHQLLAEVMPFREVFNALFFVSIGMLVDRSTLLDHAAALIAMTAICVVGKSLVGTAAVRATGWPIRVAVSVGLGLATISEFGFVVGNQALQFGLLSQELMNQLVICAVGSMLVGAILVPLSPSISLAVATYARRYNVAVDDAEEPRRSASPGHVVIVGYGLNGRNLAAVLKSIGIPFQVIEMNPGLAAKAIGDGLKVVVGDAARMSILEHAGLASARAVVVCIHDQPATRRIVAQVRAARPGVYILARTRYVGELEPLFKLGASEVIPEEFETSIEIFAHVLREFAIPMNVIEQQVALVRAGHYGMLRGRPTGGDVHREWLRWLETSATRTHLLTAGSPVIGKTLRDTDLRARTGVTIVAVTRAGQPIGNPSADFRLAEGDVLVLVGTHRELDQAKPMLDAPSAQASSL